MTHAEGGETFVRKAPACTVMDLAEAMRRKYANCREPVQIEIIGVRPGEKMHEVLVNEYEMQRCTEGSQYFTIYPEYRSFRNITAHAVGEEYTSENTERISSYEALSTLLDAVGVVEYYL
jgi:FlaA1/EpsC-like NDP-sugar epimerase